MSGLSLSEAKDAKDEAQQDGLRDNDAGIPDDLSYDYEEHDAPIVKGHPEVLVTFDYIAGYSVFNTSDSFLDARQNLENGGNKGYGNDVIVTVKNPEIVEGQLWNEDNDFRDYRVVGNPKSDVSPYERREEVQYADGEVDGVNIKGVDLGMGKFDGEPADEDTFNAEYAQFLISSSRATEILGQLDTAGKWAHDTEGNFNEGIIEAPPKMGDDDYDSDDHGAPRAIGYSELRADMVGQKGAISWTFDDDEPTTQSPVDVNIYKVVEGEDGEESLEALTSLSPEDDAYALPTYPRQGNLYWGGTDGGESHGADAEPDTDDGIEDAKEMMNDDGSSNDSSGSQTRNASDGSDYDGPPSYDELTDDGKEFVDGGVEAIQSTELMGVDDFDTNDDLDDFDERVADAKANGNIEASADDLRYIIDTRA